MKYKTRYALAPKWDIGKRPKGARGTKPVEEYWCTEEATIKHDKYYAWMKHRAQAKFRKEEHTITLDEWMDLWTDEAFLQRGRSKDSLCLQQKDVGKGWHLNNVEIVSRLTHLKRAKEYRDNKNEQR